MTLQNFPSRIFLDSSTLQTLQDYGQTIYDGEEIPPHDRLWHIPKGIENIVALRKIMHVGARGALQLAISIIVSKKCLIEDLSVIYSGL